MIGCILSFVLGMIIMYCVILALAIIVDFEIMMLSMRFNIRLTDREFTDEWLEAFSIKEEVKLVLNYIK